MKLTLLGKSHLYSLLFLVLAVTGAIAVPAPPPAIAQILEPANAAQDTKAQAVVQQFFTLLAEQKYDQSLQYLAPNLRNSGPVSQIQAAWKKVLGITGPFRSINQVLPGKDLNGYTVTATINFDNSTEDFLVNLNSNFQITSIDFLWLGNIQSNAEQFVKAISNGNYGLARSYLSPDMKEKFTPETIQQRWQALQTKTGAFKRQLGSRVVTGTTGNDAVLVSLEFEKYTGNFLIIFNPLSQIVGVSLPRK